MTGGAPFALTLPFSECVVPNINGPVYVFVVSGTQPLLNSQTNQFAASIVAGPLLAFIDTVPETLGQVAKSAPENVSSSQNISNAQAVQLADQVCICLLSTTCHLLIRILGICERTRVYLSS